MWFPGLLIVGDSITAGMTARLRERLDAIGVRDYGVLGVTGTSAKDWLTNNWLAGMLREYPAKVVVIALGTNREERDEYEYARDILALGRQAGEVGAQVFVVGPFALDDDGKWNGAVAQSVAPPGAINGYSLARGLPRTGVGNVHFTEEGYSALADRLLAEILPTLYRLGGPSASGKPVAAVMALGAGAAIGGIVADRS